MKSTGIVRRTDDLGRICIPKEIRRILKIKEGDPVEIFVDGDQIILKKYSVGCRMCGTTDDLLNVSGVPICQTCAQAIDIALSK